MTFSYGIACRQAQLAMGRVRRATRTGTAMRRPAAYLVLATVLSFCGGDDPTEPSRPVVGSVSVSPDNHTLAVGATFTLVATVRNEAGMVIGGQTVTWASSREDIATVDRTSGLVRGIAPGSAMITASVSGSTRTGSAQMAVVAPVARVDVTGRRTTVGINGTLTLTATPRDAGGTAVAGRTATWSSSDESKARVDQNTGVVTGVAPGNVTITATIDGVLGTYAIVVVDLPPPQITGISPSPLTPGAVATITGSNFDANTADVDVTVAGLATTVISATPTQVTVQLPAAFPCQATQDVAVSLTGAAGTTTRAHALRVALQRSVAIGELLVLSTREDIACNELPQTGGRYAIGIINHSKVPSSVVSFEFRGVAAPAAVPAPASVVVGARESSASRESWRAELDSPIMHAVRRHHEAHTRRLEADRALYNQLVGVRRALRARRTAAKPAGIAAPELSPAAVPLQVGATTTMRIRRNRDDCRTFSEVPARVVYVGSKSVVLEANDSPLAGTMDDDYVRLGTEYDQVMHQILLDNFGDPLAYDAQTDANGRIVMLFSKVVNDMGGLLGFASVCDLFPPTTDPAVAASNQAEIFYAIVPTSTDPGYNLSTRLGWMHQIRSTVIHELKHVTSHAVRFAHPDLAELEENWLEEATAVAAEEFYARVTYGPNKAPWRGNATYANTIYCEVRPTNPACTGKPFVMGFPFSLLYDYYEANESKSFVSNTRDDGTVYGIGWLFVRWAADQYATDEAAFFRALTNEINLTGIANIEARTGRPFDVLHPNFMMALHADDYPGFTPLASAAYTIPSWNTRDIFAGLSADFRTSHPRAFPLNVHAVSYGSFTADVAALRGTAASYVELSGTPVGSQLLHLRAVGGGPVPPGTTLRLAILRLQ